MESCDFVKLLLLSGIVSYITLIIDKTIFQHSDENKKAMEIAIKRNHVVTATLKKSYAASMDNPHNPMNRQGSGVYSYEYNGRKYTYRTHGDNLPYTITLYFAKNPRYAAQKDAVRLHKTPAWLIAAIITVFSFIILYRG